ncbi:uncharacterized protein LOC103520622 [Diaphorina citri]|uniref:Uncharacterized protein LOC103520622 n=1 Tax=Diaphorina citri TaxID=121845 RepID=A0A1S3DLA6_DIACI|nr:uncharacterized protein LOC103520622 [Diaphorina citri]KAI5732107.1 hypothetical protein M8J77_021644 [Diaphorina citri]
MSTEDINREKLITDSSNDPNLASILLNVCDQIKDTRELIKEQAGKLEQKFTDETKKINENIDAKLSPLANDVSNIKSKVQVCEEKISTLEKEKRKRNILIHGLEVHEKDSRQIETHVKQILQEKLEIGVKNEEIDFIKILGKNRKGPILLGLTTWKKKNEIIRSSAKLKGSGKNIGEDFPPEVLTKRKSLIPEMIRYRNKGHHAVIKYDRLFVDKKPVENSSTSEIHPEYVHQMEVDHDEQASKYTEEKQERNKRMLSESPESSNTIQVPKGPPKGKKKVKLGLEKAASSGNLLSYLKKRNKENNEEEGDKDSNRGKDKEETNLEENENKVQNQEQNEDPNQKEPNE